MAVAQKDSPEAGFKRFSSSSRGGRSYAQWKLLGQAADSFTSNNESVHHIDNSSLPDRMDNVLPRETESFLEPRQHNVSEFSGQLYQRSSSIKDFVNSKTTHHDHPENRGSSIGAMLNNAGRTATVGNTSVKTASSSGNPESISKQDSSVSSSSVMISSPYGKFRSFSDMRPSLALQNNSGPFSIEGNIKSTQIPSGPQNAAQRGISGPTTIKDLLNGSGNNSSGGNNSSHHRNERGTRTDYPVQSSSASLRGILSSGMSTTAGNQNFSASSFGQEAADRDNPLNGSRTLKDLIGRNRSLDDKQQAPVSVRQNVDATLRQSEEVWQRKIRGERSSGYYGLNNRSLMDDIGQRSFNSRNAALDRFSSQRAQRVTGETVYRPLRGSYSSLFKGNAASKRPQDNAPEKLQDIFRRIESCQ